MLRITELREELAVLTRRVTSAEAALSAVVDEDGQPLGKPAPSVRWWQLDGADRQAEVEALRAWLTDIYLPGYGHLAAALPQCWAEHELCLYALDVLAQHWQVLYLVPKRGVGVLAGQAEFQTRTLPLFVAQMQAEGKGCTHAARMNGAQP